MKRATLVLVLLAFCWSALAREKREPNPNLANIHKVFIKGNNEAANRARKRMLIPRDRVTRVPCFGLVGNEVVADGTLEISQDTAPDGTVTVSGNLTDHQGNLLWSDSKPSLIRNDIITMAGQATDSLVYGLEDEMCGVAPIIELSKVRKIYVSSPEEFKNVIWKSDCLSFVERPMDADALFMLTGHVGRKGRAIRALFDPKNNDYIPGWQTDLFQGVAELERAVGCTR
jgi:hypothetical protein